MLPMKYLFTKKALLYDAPTPFYFDIFIVGIPIQSDTFSLEALRESIEVYFQDENIDKGGLCLTRQK